MPRVEMPALDAIVESLVLTRQAVARLQAFEATLYSAAADVVGVAAQVRGIHNSPDIPLREASAELGAAVRVSDRTVQRQMSDASILLEWFSATHAAWAAGRIDRAHVGVIVEAGSSIHDAGARSAYESLVLERAEGESASRLRPIARVLAARVQPETIDERHERARRLRAVRVFDLEDGMARLTADLPAVLAHGAFDRLTQLAHRARALEIDAGAEPRTGETAKIARASSPAAVTGGSLCTDDGDPRAMDEVRADVFADLLLTSMPSAHDTGTSIAAHVQITVPVLTAAGAGDEPALLVGHGPVDSATARTLLGSAAGWDRVMTDPWNGAVLAVDRYRPSEELRRFLRVRDEACRFPGCRMATWRSDIDHTIDAARGGATSSGNLAHLCRRHHVLKHATDWTVHQRDRGVLEWTSPTARTYLDRPPATLRFVPTDDPPPF